MVDQARTPNSVTAVIINYNGRRFLDELLTSLQRQSYQDFSILMIDNNSQDGSVRYVRNNYPRVRVLEQSENLGFAKAGNLAVRASDTAFVALLNTDLRLDRDWMEAMLATALGDPRAGAVASKIRLYNDPGKLNGVGGQMNRLGYTWDRGMFEEDRGQYDQPAEVLFASAGAALFSRAAFLEAGGFDERFFMYHEDVDICWRMWLLGYRVVTSPGAVAYHHFGASTRASHGMNWREITGERNNIRSLIKNYQPATLGRALWDLLLLPQPAGRKVYQFRNFLWNLWYLPETLRLRRTVQERRSITDQDLEYLIVQSKHVPIRL